jgi:hypothetical protein
MTTAFNQSDSYARLTYEVDAWVKKSRDDFRELSHLHPDFIDACLAALDSKKRPASDGIIGWEIIPHLVFQSLNLDDQKRRLLSAASVALSGYTFILDGELDQKGYLDGRLSVAASALFGWAMATLGQFTAGTPFAEVFVDNINRAFAGQYRDMQLRGVSRGDRAWSDIEKNRGFVAGMAAFCGAGGEPDDRLVRMVETIIGPMQIWDDFQDVEEDCREDNHTPFVQILTQCVSIVEPALSAKGMYSALIRDPRTTELFKRAQDGIQNATLLLDANRDQSLIAYYGEWRARNTALINALEGFQRAEPGVDEAFVLKCVDRLLEMGGST